MNNVEKQHQVLLKDEDRPYNPFRKQLYTVEELMDGYSSSNHNGSLDSIMARYYTD